MKKLLFGILTFLGIGFSFCSADAITYTGSFSYDSTSTISDSSTILIFPLNFPSGPITGTCTFTDLVSFTDYVLFPMVIHYGGNAGKELVLSTLSYNVGPFSHRIGTCKISNDGDSCSFYYDGHGYLNTTNILYSSLRIGRAPNSFSFSYSCTFEVPSESGGGSSGSGGSCPDKSIDVYYNNGNSVESITCDGVQAILFNGLSTITYTNTFTPYFNINYKDEDNQLLTESYSKDVLYLSGGQFKKTYTGNNDWILTVQGGDSDNSFSGYLPVFDITGGIDEVTESGNIFNNFAENSIKLTLSNIPSYIQYVIIFMLLFFILGFIRKFKRR